MPRHLKWRLSHNANDAIIAGREYRISGEFGNCTDAHLEWCRRENLIGFLFGYFKDGWDSVVLEEKVLTDE